VDSDDPVAPKKNEEAASGRPLLFRDTVVFKTKRKGRRFDAPTAADCG